MTDVLSRIIDTKHEELAALRSCHGKAELEAMIADQAPPRDFTGALRRAADQGYGLIAEVKSFPFQRRDQG